MQIAKKNAPSNSQLLRLLHAPHSFGYWRSLALALGYRPTRPTYPPPYPLPYKASFQPCLTRNGSSRSVKSSTSSASSRTTPSIPAWTTGEFCVWRWVGVGLMFGLMFCVCYAAMLCLLAPPTIVLRLKDAIPFQRYACARCEHRNRRLHGVEHTSFSHIMCRGIFGGQFQFSSAP